MKQKKTLLIEKRLFAWAVMDSNHRRRKPAELQSAPFGHSGNCPCLFAGAKVVIILNDANFERIFCFREERIANATGTHITFS